LGQDRTVARLGFDPIVRFAGETPTACPETAARDGLMVTKDTATDKEPWCG